LSGDTIKCIGNKGHFTKKELIEHVNDNDSVGKIIQEAEMEWIKSFKNGFINELCSAE